ncbi:MAG TPA: SAM-dependent methyltransferase, partial [Agromyces mariniharenae]|nr:SAM-dependent methyltransferase [Agromyces mariniharenae]
MTSGIAPLDDRTTDLVRRLGDDLRAAGFTVEALDRLWGADAAAALHRGERVPARRVLDARRADHDPAADLASLAELFVLGLPVPEREAAHALPSLGVDGAVELGLLTRDAATTTRAGTAGDGASVRPLLDLRPYAFVDAHGDGRWWILSDLGEVAL